MTTDEKHELILQLHAEGEGGGAEPTADGGEPAGGGTASPEGNGDPAGGGKPNVFDGLGGNGGGQGDEQVPEAYEFKLGEGLEMTEELTQKFTEIAKGAGLKQSQVDALMEMHCGVVKDIMEQASRQQEEWISECDKQGLCDNVKLGYARDAVNTFGGGEAMDVLLQTGAINHPAVLKMMQHIGSLLAEDVPPKDGTDNNSKATADMLFPNSKY